jgi:hypothetical protein
MLLDRRAFDGAIGTENAAIPRIGFEQRSTAFALIEKLASISRHGFGSGIATVRAGNG